MTAAKNLLSSSSVEWYTAPATLAVVRRLLGRIDLDPASCEAANEVVGAEVYLDRAVDGLSVEWCGRVFCNPPYGRGVTDRWVDKMIEEHTSGRIEAGVMLLNATPDRRWFQRLWDYPICFAFRRMRAWRPGGEAKSPTHPHVLVGFGLEDRVDFKAACEGYGHVVWPGGVQ